MALVILWASSYSGVKRLKSCVNPGAMATVRIAFQIKNLIMECLVTVRSFQVIFEWAR